MHAIGLMFDGQAPVIINKQPRIIFAPQRDRGNHIVFDFAIAFILDTQLDSANARVQQAFDPRNAIDDRIKPQAERNCGKIGLIHQASSCFR